MPSITSPIHESFPKDDKLYRVYWAGETLLPDSPSQTPRTRVWLREIDEHGRYLDGSPYVQVTESAGSIPRFALWSCWRGGRSSHPKFTKVDRPEVFEIDAPERWQVVKAGDAYTWQSRGSAASNNHRWINPSDMRLVFETSHNRRVHGHLARVVPIRTITGRELIIPSYEILRSFLANTTDIALALLSTTWDSISGRFLLSKSQNVGPEGLRWDMDLAPGIPHSAVPNLAMLSFIDDAAQAANHVYPALVGQGPLSQPAWISAFPPVLGNRFRIRAHTIPLHSRNALLVTKIVDFSLPETPAILSYSFDAMAIPDGSPIEHDTDTQKVARSGKQTARVSRPGDRKPGLRLVQLPSMATRWLGLPIPQRRARRFTKFPLPNVAQRTTAPSSHYVSVGESGSQRSPTPARFTPEEELIIEDRFHAVRDLFDNLVAEGFIESVQEYPLVRPAPPENPIYCEFPASVNDIPLSWSIVRSPFPRTRLALVLEFIVDNRFVYWIETEMVRAGDGHHSMVVEMINRGQLDEGMLTALLDLCANENGVWPKKLLFGTGTLLSVRARHSKAGGQMSVNAVLLPLARLKRMRDQLNQADDIGVVVVDVNPPE